MVNMGIFHRTLSSGSRTSTTFSASPDNTTPRTSTESNKHEPAKDAKTSPDSVPKTQEAPLLTLPIELIQNVTSYLDAESSASFSLSSRYIYYALGSNHLTAYVNSTKSRFVKRRAIEALVERAFPGHWFCAWCDTFHSWTSTTGPKDDSGTAAKKRDCLDFNSHLPASPEYILRFHHVRLALNHALRGPAHGIPLSAFSHTHAAMATLHRTPVPTKLDISAKIVAGHFLLHASFAIILPAWSTARKSILAALWPLFPPILTAHRDSDNGHTGLMAAVDNVVRRGWTYAAPQACATCRTDWSVSAHFFAHASGAQTRLVVQTWRDLGDGRNPFETAWRAHGVGVGAKGSAAPRETGVRAGDVKRGFECGLEEIERAVSPARARIHRGFMGRDGDVRRSRARPCTWRTARQSEEVERREIEERMEVARGLGESLVRLEAERGRV